MMMMMMMKVWRSCDTVINRLSSSLTFCEGDSLLTKLMPILEQSNRRLFITGLDVASKYRGVENEMIDCYL